MVDFLIQNWKILISLLLFFIYIIVCIFKKTKPILVSDEKLTEVLSCLPNLIKEAEQIYGAGHGKDKFKYVFEMAIDILHESTSISTSELVYCFGKKLTDEIEDILSTPKKK